MNLDSANGTGFETESNTHNDAENGLALSSNASFKSISGSSENSENGKLLSMA